MSPEEYETLVSTIANNIQQCHSILFSLKLGAGRKNLIAGASGYKHQIDVSLQDAKRFFIIECKKWVKPIGVNEVLVLTARAADVQKLYPSLAITPILVSTKNITSGAQQLADYFRVAVEIVKSADEFGFRIDKIIHQGISEGMRFGDECTVE